MHPTYVAPPICGAWEDIVLTLTVTNRHGLRTSDSRVVRVVDMVCHPFLPRWLPVSPALIAPICTPVVAPFLLAPVFRPIVPICPPVVVAFPPAPVFRPIVPICPPVVVAVPPVPVVKPVIPICPPVVVAFPPVPVVKPVIPICPPVVVQRPPAPPIIAPLSVQSVDEGGSIRLRGAVWDPDSNLVGFRWTADRGKFDDPTSLTPTYFAPLTDRCGGEQVSITLTAVDSCGARSATRLLLHINNLNRLPVANAGADFVMNECTSVQLVGSASDSDSDPLTFHWTAACGRGSFSNPHVLHPVYTAPTTAFCEGEKIVLTLTVTDACGARASDSLTVHVRNVNRLPVANAGADFVMNECT
ncbi:hypothetical protein LR032_04680, partial [Candidatus Bipolaricaulota bacterium]|nr:hypothetical protein [Candidatus Bipolaricaulota bacterium]